MKAPQSTSQGFMGGSRRTAYQKVPYMRWVAEWIGASKQGGRGPLSELTSEVYPLMEQSERNPASVVSSQLF